MKLPIRPRSIRARTTAGSVAIVAAVLVVIAIVTIVALETTLENNIRSSARSTASSIAASLGAGLAPDDVMLGVDDDTVVQITTADGSIEFSDAPPVIRPALPLLDDGETTTFKDPRLDDDPFIYVGREVETAEGRMHIVVGKNSDIAIEAASTSIRITIVAFPLLLLLVGWITWSLTGRALSPVEKLRRKVESIPAHQTSERLEIPATDDEIARLARTMNGLLERLETSIEKRKRFVSDASHELRNPIAAIRQHAEVALAHPSITDARSLAKDILSEDSRLERIAEDLLLLARADEKALRLDIHPIDLDDIVLEEAGRVKRAQILKVDTSSVGAARVDADRSSMQRAVRNIIDNACRHARNQISLSLRSLDGSAVMCIDDDGEGIPPQTRSEVFDRFSRSEESRDRRYGGAGLGLAIVSEIVTAHGGTVTATDAPLGGARIEVVLPISNGRSRFSVDSGPSA